ncbi:MAG: hypothetical protein ACTS5V_01735, partial [Giesbergeria sp.]
SVLEFFARADTATYLAKEGGRNQVVVEEPVDRRASNDVFGDGEAEVDSRLPDGESNSDFALLEEAGFVKERRAALL